MPYIPIGQKPYYSIDPVSKGLTVADTCINGWIDASGTVRRAPGLTKRYELPAKSQGLFWWDNAGIMVAVADGQLYTINRSGVVIRVNGTQPGGDLPAIFSDGQMLDGSPILYVASGDKLAYVLGGTSHVATDSPEPCSHVAYLSSTFIANQLNTNRFYLTDINPTTNDNDVTYWSSSDNPLTSDTKGDFISGLFSGWQELSIWGRQGIETWNYTGGTPQVELQAGAFSECGLIAPYSVKQADNTWFGLCQVDGSRAVIRLQGRAPSIISQSIYQLLNQYDCTVATADMLNIGATTFYLLHFPNDNITWAYDLVSQTWFPWQRWETHLGKYTAYGARYAAFSEPWGKQLICSATDGSIYEVDLQTFTDNGNELRTEYVTGWINWQTDMNKRSNMLRIRLKRNQGVVNATNTPKLMLKYRKDGNQTWESEEEISLGNSGEHEFYVDVNRLGIYRSRQYSFSITDNATLALVSVEEQVDKLNK